MLSGGRLAADALGAAAGRALANAAPLPAPATDAPAFPDLPLALGEPLPYPLPAPAVAGDAPAPRPRAGRGLSAPRPPTRPAPRARPRGILVRAAAVARAVRSGQRPAGHAVPASGARPAGVLLTNVSAFGTALRDGDLLVRVGGAPATSPAAVIAAVSGALRAGARVVTAEIWRAGERLPVAVEIPALPRPAR